MLRSMLIEFILDIVFIPIAFVLSRYILNYDVHDEIVVKITLIYACLMAFIQLLIKMLNPGEITVWIFIVFKYFYGVIAIFYILSSRKNKFTVPKSLNLALLTVLINIVLFYILYLVYPTLKEIFSEILVYALI